MIVMLLFLFGTADSVVAFLTLLLLFPSGHFSAITILIAFGLLHVFGSITLAQSLPLATDELTDF